MKSNIAIKDLVLYVLVIILILIIVFMSSMRTDNQVINNEDEVEILRSKLDSLERKNSSKKMDSIFIVINDKSDSIIEIDSTTLNEAKEWLRLYRLSQH